MAARVKTQILVIGSGAGGASCAALLAKAGYQVTVLEEGGHYPHDAVPNKAASAMNKMWRASGLTVALGRAPIAYAEGRCVGGGTEINSAIFQNAPPEILDFWAEEIDDFSAGDLQDGYDWAYEALNVSTSKAGAKLGAPSEILARAASAMGWAHKELPRAEKNCKGTNLCAFGCPTGGKQSMSSTLLPAACKNGAKILPHCRVVKIVTKDGRVRETHALKKLENGAVEKLTIEADAVFVACGTIHTAHILQKSKCKSARSSAFQLHPTLRVLAEFDEEIAAADAKLPLYAVTEFLPNLRMGGSVFTDSTFGMALAENWPARGHLIDKYKNLAAYYVMIRPQGWGRVRGLPAFSDPLVTYGLTQADKKLLLDGLGKLSESLFKAGAKKIYPGIKGHNGWGGAGALQADISNRHYLRKLNLMSIHLFSSCSPLHNERGNDSYGKINGLDNLYVADASLVPSAPCVNPQATIMAFTKRAIDKFIAEDK